MKLYLLPILLISTAVHGNYISQLEASNRLHEHSLLYVLNNRAALKVDLASADIKIATEALMKVLIAWELSDGVNGIETGDVLIEAWKHNPLLVGSWFDSKPNSKKSWLTSQDYLFNGLLETGSYQEALKLKDEVVASLQNLPVGKSRTCDQYLKVLLALEIPNYENS